MLPSGRNQMVYVALLFLSLALLQQWAASIFEVTYLSCTVYESTFYKLLIFAANWIADIPKKFQPS